MRCKYMVFNGYTKLGDAECYNDAKKICFEYCKNNKISFELKRELYSTPDVHVLIYQYETLYLETFVITHNYEIEAENKRCDETKKCKVCDCKMVWKHPDVSGLFMSSSCNIEDWSICYSCMIEHCCATNCLQCSYGKYPNCRFQDMKQFYREAEER